MIVRQWAVYIKMYIAYLWPQCRGTYEIRTTLRRSGSWTETMFCVRNRWHGGDHRDYLGNWGDTEQEGD